MLEYFNESLSSPSGISPLNLAGHKEAICLPLSLSQTEGNNRCLDFSVKNFSGLHLTGGLANDALAIGALQNGRPRLADGSRIPEYERGNTCFASILLRTTKCERSRSILCPRAVSC